MRKTAILLVLSVLGILGVKAFYDVYQIRYPAAVVDRTGSAVKSVVLSWETALQLAAVYQWTILGSESEFINKQVMRTTQNAGVRWSEVIPVAAREQKILAFASRNQIDVNPWVWEKQIAEYSSVNDFFARRYHPESSLHPAQLFGASDSTAIGSAAEGKIVAYSSVEESQRFWIKNEAFTLEKTGLPSWQAYAEHPMVIFRLAPYDYHRYHAPVSGTVVHLSSSEGYEDTWSHSVKPMILHHPDFNLFNENRRRFLVIDTEFGKIALMFVGAVTVDSINFNQEIELGRVVAKGDDLGTFKYGGSTVVMFTDSDSFHIDEDILRQSKAMVEVQVRCGEVIGSISGADASVAF